MVGADPMDWSELGKLHVVRNVSTLLGRRWGLGLGIAGAGLAVPPQDGPAALGPRLCSLVQGRGAGVEGCMASAAALFAEGGLKIRARPCHVGLCELAAPIVVDDEVVGTVIGGGYVRGDDAMREVRAALGRLEISPADQRAAAAVPVLSKADESFVAELLKGAADEIATYLRRKHQLAAAGGDGPRTHFDAIFGSSPAMQALYAVLDRVVAADTTVLVQGENGTGKELVARAIHRHSARGARPFVVQNCSAFNDNLLDSELFGHKRGAFTGAVNDKPGLFEVADGGTFFLDEIGDMSPALQVKVLRVLQEGTFTPVGDTVEKHVDVRIVAATNRDLKAMVARGEFREDLYYRINVINLVLPPLRERRPDIPLLAERFLGKHPIAPGEHKTLSPEALALLVGYQWPGNVRELENEIERAVVLSGHHRVLRPADLSERIRGSTPREDPLDELMQRSLPEALRVLEERMIRAALGRNKGNKTRAAAELEISRRNLIRLVQKHGL